MTGDQHRGIVAQNILTLRSLRERSFPRELFDEYAWEMLLLLFVGLSNNETISESTLIERANVTLSTGRRWIAHLVSDGQVVDRDEGGDVFLTQAATESLRAFLDRIAALPWAEPTAWSGPAGTLD